MIAEDCIYLVRRQLAFRRPSLLTYKGVGQGEGKAGHGREQAGPQDMRFTFPETYIGTDRHLVHNTIH